MPEQGADLNELAKQQWRIVVEGDDHDIENDVHIVRVDPRDSRGRINIADMFLGCTMEDAYGDEGLDITAKGGLYVIAVSLLPEFADLAVYIRDQLALEQPDESFIETLEGKINALTENIDGRSEVLHVGECGHNFRKISH